MGTYCIYIHINKINDKVYIGYTNDKDPSKRWGPNGIHYKSHKYFWYAIQKYGWDGFYHLVIKTGLTHKEAQEEERRYIELYNAFGEGGYNLTKGGDGHDLGRDCYNPEVKKARQHRYHEENKDRIHEMHKINYEKNREFYIEYQREYEKNNPEVKERQKAYREANKEKKRLYDIEYRKKNKEHKRLVDKQYRERRKLLNPKVYKKPVRNIDTDEVFESIQAVANHYGFSFASVSQNVRGKTKHCHGMHFEFIQN